uniref:Transmembrane protein n=1 Tax=Geladintestivirus 6 TaxID=3233138 RepID=A0AAU8MHS9_9CAUD
MYHYQKSHLYQYYFIIQALKSTIMLIYKQYCYGHYFQLKVGLNLIINMMIKLSAINYNKSYILRYFNSIKCENIILYCKFQSCLLVLYQVNQLNY